MSDSATPDVPTAIEQVPSISAAANAYQLAMSQQAATPTSNASLAHAPDMIKDIVMTENTLDRPAVCLSHR
jgi:COMPASS component SDC1